MKDDWQHGPPGPEGYDYDAGTGGYSPAPGDGPPPGYGAPPGYGPPPPPAAFAPGHGAPPGYGPPPGYGAPPGYGPPPPPAAFAPGHGAPPGYGPPPAYGIPPAYGGSYREPPGQAGMVVSLVLAIIMVSSLCNVFAIPGIVFAAIALAERRDHGRAARFKRYSWIANGVSVVLLVLLVAVVIATEG